MSEAKEDIRNDSPFTNTEESNGNTGDNQV